MRHVLVVALVLGCRPDALPEPPTTPTCEPTAVVPVHQLTATQLERALSDLMGVTADVSALPLESRLNGFSNQTGVASVGELHSSQLTRVTEDVATAAVGMDDVPIAVVEFEDFAQPVGTVDDLSATGDGVWWTLSWDETHLDLPLEVAETGTYRLVLRSRWIVGSEVIVHDPVPPLAHVSLDGEATLDAEVVGTYWDPKPLEVVVHLEAGAHDLDLDLEWRGTRQTVAGDNSVGFDAVELLGPLTGRDTPLRARLAACGDPQEACAREVAAEVARRAWRRSPTPAEVDALGDLIDLALAEGDPAHVGLGLALEAIVLSPSFLFVDTTNADGRLDDAALASRLALTVWSSVPDAALLDCVDRGALLEDGPCGLTAQLARMLEDPRASALVDGFGFEWLEVDRLESVFRDPEVHPEFDPAAMLAETRDLLAMAWQDGMPVDELLHPEDALLAQRSVLTATSQPTRTSPTLRGAFVLSKLLCEPPEPPPDEVPELGDSPADLRDQLSEHVSNPACASCHAGIDPYGLALEHYDAVGAWRDVYDSGRPVDATTALPSGHAVSGADDLFVALQADPAVAACVAEHLFTWSLGHRPADEDVVITQMAAAPTLPAMLEILVTSDSYLCAAR
jgi:hypothetical protein